MFNSTEIGNSQQNMIHSLTISQFPMKSDREINIQSLYDYLLSRNKEISRFKNGSIFMIKKKKKE